MWAPNRQGSLLRGEGKILKFNYAYLISIMKKCINFLFKKAQVKGEPYLWFNFKGEWEKNNQFIEYIECIQYIL